MMHDRLKVWDWRDAVRQDKGLQPYTKLVLYTVAIYMNGLGEGAFPSYKTLAADCGLHRSTVIAHIKLACEAGYLEKEITHREDGTHTSNRYCCRYPATVAVVQQTLEIRGDAATGGSRPTRPPPVDNPVEGEGGWSSIATRVVVNSDPILTPPINSNTHLTSLCEDDGGEEFPEQMTAGKVAEGEPDTPGQLTAASVSEFLRRLPSGVRAARSGQPTDVSEQGKQVAEEALERLSTFVVPAALPELQELVVRRRAEMFVRRGPEQLVTDFTQQGWAKALGCFPLWAVDAAFDAYRAEHKTRRPRADEIAVICRELVAPCTATARACEKYLAAPIEEPARGKSPEEREHMQRLFSDLQKQLAETPGPAPPPG